jgi:hypothetical protein
MNTVDDKLLERMKRLLAMSQDASSENEAMIAARRLHALLSKHDISMSALEDKPDEVDEHGWETRNVTYRRIIGVMVARLYYCDMYYVAGYHRRGYTKLMFVGKEQNRKIAETITVQVIRMIDREASRYSRTRHGKIINSVCSDFKQGAAARIAQRCRDLIAQARAGNLMDEDTGENLPMLAPKYDRERALIEDFLENKKLGTGKTRTRSCDLAAVTAGKNAGDRAALHQGLKQTAPQLLSNS